jgi:hypothetical protein
MAVIVPTYPISRTGKQSTVLWESISGSDTGEWIELDDFNDNTVTVSGTFDSNTLTMQGANAADKSDAFTLTDNNGLSIAFTAAGGKLISEAPRFIRPSSSAGASADLDVLVNLRKV